MPALRRRATAGSASTEQHDEVTTSMPVAGRGRRRSRPASISGRIRVAQVRRRGQLVGDPAVGDLAGQPGQRRAHRGEVDRDVGAQHRVGPLVAADLHRLALAVEVDRLAGGAAGPEGADVADRLAQVGDRLVPVDVVPVLVEPLDAGAEAEHEPAAGQLVEVEGLERGHHRAAGEGQRDRRADLVPSWSPGRPRPPRRSRCGAARAPRRPRRRRPRRRGRRRRARPSVSPQGP